MCRCVCSRNLVNEEAMAQWGLSRQKKKKDTWGFIKHHVVQSCSSTRPEFSTRNNVPVSITLPLH